MTNAHSLVPSLEEERNPFIYDTCLWNNASGVTTDSAVNVVTASAPETLSWNRYTGNINGKIVQVDLMLPFQRLAITETATYEMPLSRNAIQPVVHRRQVGALV